MDIEDARRLALDMPEAMEKSHFGKPDFRIRNHIFMTLPGEKRAVFKLMPDQQEMLAGAEPGIFAAVPGGWGRQGWTTMFLENADEATLKSALVMAWRNVAPVSLRRTLDGRTPAADQPAASDRTDDLAPVSGAGPLASPAPWTFVAEDYAESTRPFLEAFSRSAIERLRFGPGSEAIDIACGPGTAALLLSPNVRRVACVDFSEGMLNQLRLNMERTGLSNIEPCQADGQALPYEDGCFDIGISMFGLMFFPDRARGFAELCRVLRPRGEAVVSSWAPVDRSPLLRVVFEALGSPSANSSSVRSGLEDPALLEREMKDAGFADVRVEPVSHAMTVTTVAAFWRDMQRGVVPIALLKGKSSAEEWALIEQTAKKNIAEALPELPATLPSTAYLAIGRKP